MATQAAQIQALRNMHPVNSISLHTKLSSQPGSMLSGWLQSSVPKAGRAFILQVQQHEQHSATGLAGTAGSSN
jgi:hypothetical protein